MLHTSNHASLQKYFLGKSSENSQLSHPIWRRYLFGNFFFALIFTFWQSDAMPLYVHAAGILLMALCTYPIAGWYANKNRQSPMFELLCVAYGIQYSLPLYLQYNEVAILGNPLQFHWDETFYTLLLTILGVGTMIFCYNAVQQSRFAATLPTFDLPLAPQKRGIYFGLILGTAFAITFLRVSGLTPALNSRFGAIISLISTQSLIAITVLGYMLYTKKMSGIHWWILLVGSLLLAMGLGLVTGMLENTLVPLALLFLAAWQANKKLPWQILMIAVLLYLFLQPIKGIYRSQAWDRGNSAVFSVNERFQIWFLSIQDSIDDRSGLYTDNDDSFFSEKQLRITLTRLDLLHVFVLVQKMTPSVIPHYYGASYQYLLYGWVPRLVWVNKPIAQEYNNIFALDYMILHHSQIGKTMTGIGHIAEAYANFGVIGIMIVLGLEGIIFALMSRVLNSQHSEGGVAIYLSIMIFLLNGIGSATAPMYSVLIQTILANTLLLRIFAASSFQFQHSSQDAKKSGDLNQSENHHPLLTSEKRIYHL